MELLRASHLWETELLNESPAAVVVGELLECLGEILPEKDMGGE